MGPSRLAHANHPRWRWSPTWRRTEDDNLRRVRPDSGNVNWGGVESNKVTLMTSSGHGHRGCFTRGWMA